MPWQATIVTQNTWICHFGVTALSSPCHNTKVSEFDSFSWQCLTCRGTKPSNFCFLHRQYLLCRDTNYFMQRYKVLCSFSPFFFNSFHLSNHLQHKIKYYYLNIDDKTWQNTKNDRVKYMHISLLSLLQQTIYPF